ncbi:MAG: radical SAM protein [Planctomycetaceae bacterium]|nr:hypothetical protein [Planctomycetaceae bacterium]
MREAPAVVEIKEILIRTSGFLGPVCSHSLQPYRGCAFGNSLCGVGCYVRHNPFVTKGRPWGAFLEARLNAARRYRETYPRELAWTRRQQRKFTIFCASSTDPFPPQERKLQITSALLRAMGEFPPDGLILQTHSPDVCREIETLLLLAERTALRIHLSIEGDRDRLPGLPPPAASVERRFQACRKLKEQGLNCVVTVAPLHPLQDPEQFFQRVAECASGVIIDHFIEGDGSLQGRRTLKTGLPAAMQAVLPESVTLDYRDRMIDIARSILPGRVGVGQSGFAGDFT